jgi:AcrR family transcriptional regulator
MRVVKPSRAEKVQANRTSVLAAARRVFLAKGYAGATLEAIAEEAGFSKGVVYSQFGGKADLFLALLDARIDERAAQNARLAADAGAGAAAIRALLANSDRDTQVEAGWARVLIEFRSVAMRDPELNRRYAASHARTRQLLADLVERVLAAAGIEITIPPRALAEFILAFGAGLALERAADPDALSWPDQVRIMSRALGLDPDDTAAPGRRSEEVAP